MNLITESSYFSLQKRVRELLIYAIKDKNIIFLLLKENNYPLVLGTKPKH